MVFFFYHVETKVRTSLFLTETRVQQASRPQIPARRRRTPARRRRAWPRRAAARRRIRRPCSMAAALRHHRLLATPP